MKLKNEEAVSPVVGVMLMLVVTIIIAAVVSGFAGGLAGDQQKTPQVSLKAEPVVQAFADEDKTNGTNADYPSDFTAANGIMFENVGGDTFRLTDINVILDTGGTKYTITPVDQINNGGWICLPADLTDGGYFLKIGGATKMDKTIAPGDKFMFYADGHYDSSEEPIYTGPDNGKYLVWRPADTTNGIGAQFGTKVGWTIVDRDTSKPMASGYVVFR
jgi:FlaG/FlaF family flagellin (archaellin)